MKKILTSILIFTCCAFSVYAQNYLYKEVKEAKIPFEKLTVFQLCSPNTKLLENFNNKEDIVSLKYISSILDNTKKVILLDIPLK